MTAIKISRRRLLQLLPLAAVGSGLAGWASSATERIYSAASNHKGEHFLCCWSEGRLHFQVPGPGRGHDVLINRRTDSALFFARRPGTWFVALDAQSGEQQVRVNSPAGRHFYGHGALIDSGRLLLTSENDFANGGRGVIGVYDCLDNYRRIGEFASAGIGPHQLAALPDGKTIAVANGGILTLPGSAREKLNIETMQPSLCYIDGNNGKLLGEWRPPHHQLSLRHLDVCENGRVVVGAQFEGPSSEQYPLLFSHQGEARLSPLQADRSVWRSHQQYIASVAAIGDTVVATSPRGGCISVWQHNTFTSLQRLEDVAGVAFDKHTHKFITSNGRGQLVSVTGEGLELNGRASHLRWDNHMDISS